jgi:hypothetical protein
VVKQVFELTAQEALKILGKHILDREEHMDGTYTTSMTADVERGEVQTFTLTFEKKK